MGKRPRRAIDSNAAPKPSMAVSNLIKALDEWNNDMIWDAICTLKKKADPTAVTALIRVLDEHWNYNPHSDDSDVCPIAVEALVKIGAPAIPSLRTALTHEEDRVRCLAAEALERIE